MSALTFSRFGGPEVLEYATLPAPALQPGHVLLRPEAIGLNFADVYRRNGTYHLAGTPPYVLGYEAAGTVAAVAAVADDVTEFRVGQRVAVADGPHANAELVLAPATHLLPLPDAVRGEPGLEQPAGRYGSAAGQRLFAGRYSARVAVRAGAAAGRPTIVVPHQADQPAWGQRLWELGVGSRPIPRRQLTADNLAAAICYVAVELSSDNTMHLGGNWSSWVYGTYSSSAMHGLFEVGA